MAGLFNFGSSKSSQQSSGSSQGSSFVDQAQAPFLDFLRNSSMDAFSGFQQGGQDISQMLGGLFGQGQEMLGGLGQNQFMDALGQQAQGNPNLVAAQTEQLGNQLGDFFNEQLMPGISRNATGIGQLGGGRQGVAEGQAAGQVADAFSQGALGFQTADNQRAQQAAQSGAGFMNQAQMGGLDSLQSLMGLLQGGQSASMAPFAMLAQLFGDPTVLSQQTSENQSSGSSRSFNVGVGGG